MLKRLFDIIASLAGLVLLSPVLLVVALLVRVKLGAPVLFKQQRPGLHGQPFIMYKFRTMRATVDTGGQPLPDSQRITPLGRVLRATSLDELPELWNVLKGDMSLVGPRPLLMEYLPYYTEQERLRHSVRPGITGLAQVSGRSNTTWDNKLKLDVQYVNERSFLLDLKIVLMTIYQVIQSKNVEVVPSVKYQKLSDERSFKSSNQINASKSNT